MKRGLITSLVIIVSILITGGIVYAASTRNITATLGGVSGDAFDLDGTMIVDSLKVGAQGVGGVTFFNGTIVNETKTTSGADIPVTFGDNVRIDGRVYRGALAGVTDTQPFIVNDNMEVVGSLTTNSLITNSFTVSALTVASLVGTGNVSSDNLASNSVTTAKILDGTIASADLADSSVTSAKINDGTIASADIASGAVTQGVQGTLVPSTNILQADGFGTLTSLSITTGASSLFCSWSGWGDTINDYEAIRIQMLMDGTVIPGTMRITRTSAGLVSTASLETHAIISVAAGAHTVALQWSTDDTSANMYDNTLDCIELKK